MQVLEAAAVAPHHDQVHALLVLDLEVPHRPAAGAADAEAQLARPGALEHGGLERERQAVPARRRDREPAPERPRRTGVASGVGRPARFSPLRSGPTVAPANAAAPNTRASTAAKTASFIPTFIAENVAYPRGVSV